VVCRTVTASGPRAEVPTITLDGVRRPPSGECGCIATCNAQLRAFQRASATLADLGVQVAALSVDDEAATAGLIAKHGLTFPVGFGADARAVAGLTGAFVNPGPVYLQSTGFVLDPQGKVVVSVYSSGAIGRLVREDVAGLVRYLRDHASASA
jgi:peroxiredoxin